MCLFSHDRSCEVKQREHADLPQNKTKRKHVGIGEPFCDLQESIRDCVQRRTGSLRVHLHEIIQC